MNDLRALFLAHQDWLTRRVIDYAKAHGYVVDTPSLAYLWESSICGLAEPIAIAFDDPGAALEVRHGADYANHPLTRFGIVEARQHRARGVALADFLGLLKYYRRAHVDLLDHAVAEAATRDLYRPLLDDLFDLIEIGVITEWAALDREARIAELQDANRRLALDKAKYVTVFESLANPALVLDEAGRIESANWAAARTFDGVTRSPGSGAYSGAVPERLERQTRALLAAAGAGGEVELETAQGQRHFTVTSRRLFDVTDRLDGQVLLLNDVSDYVAVREDAALVNRAKSAFLATMSHDVRTPLNGILGAVELLRVAPDSPAADEALAAIGASAQVLLNLVDDVLDHAKLEAGAVVVRCAPVRLAELVRTAIAVVAPRAAAKGLRLEVEVAAEADVAVLSDGAKLQRIVVNLLDNAVKFTAAGWVALRVGATRTGADRVALRIDVADSGIGIAPARLAHLFDPFTQADPSIQDTYGGTGLGLAICRHLALALGGSLDATSQPGEGSVFTLDLALPLAADGGDPAAATAPAVPAASLQVLLVEDNEVNRLVTAGLLRHAGHEVTTAATGAAALQAMQRHAFDAVVLDLRLPDVDGVVLAGELRAAQPRERGHLPIVALSASVGDAPSATWAAARIDAYLTKPCTLPALDEALRRVVRTPAEVPPSGSPAETSIDRQRLEGHLAVLGAATLRTIVEGFAQSARQAEHALLRVRTTADLPAAVDALHALRGAASQLGLVGLARTCGRLEIAAGEGQLATVEAERNRFGRALVRAQSALDAVVEDVVVGAPQRLRRT